MKKKSVLTVIICYACIITVTVLCVIIGGRSYTCYMPSAFESDNITIEYSNEGIVENTYAGVKNGVFKVSFKALKEGKTRISAFVNSNENEFDKMGVLFEFEVLPSGILYFSGYDFGGHVYVFVGMALLIAVSFVFFALQYRYRRKNSLFSYKTVLDFGFILFFGLQTAVYIALLFGRLILPEHFDAWQLFNLSGFIMSALFMLSTPFLVVFALFMSVSNLSLIRHEGFGKNNFFGLLISAAMFFGSVVCVVAALKNPNSTGVELSEIRDSVIRTAVSSSFVYFECLLFATLYYTQRVAKFKPDYNKDFIIILGCKIRKDGTPLPLLKGRIDKALEFYHAQLEKTGKKAFFVVSGGKGDDEIISEAQSMKNYLISKNIDESSILVEDKSTTTLENMAFSKKICFENKPDPEIVFATTNYHVFRSGMFSVKAGMKSQGIGAKTKWYFWPNAQIREFIGLLFKEWGITAFFIFLSVLLSTVFANIPAVIDFFARF